MSMRVEIIEKERVMIWVRNKTGVVITKGSCIGIEEGGGGGLPEK